MRMRIGPMPLRFLHLLAAFRASSHAAAVPWVDRVSTPPGRLCMTLIGDVAIDQREGGAPITAEDAQVGSESRRERAPVCDPE